MADAAGRKTGGRQKGTPNKRTIEKERAMEAVASEVLGGMSLDEMEHLQPRDVLMLVMYSALKAKNLPLAMAAATELMPYYHPKKAPRGHAAR